LVSDTAASLMELLTFALVRMPGEYLDGLEPAHQSEGPKPVVVIASMFNGESLEKMGRSSC
jgi:hypothetical protein